MNLVSWAAATPARRIAITAILVIIGLAAIAVAIIYGVHANTLPKVLVGKSRHGIHPIRIAIAAIVGVGLLILAWLVNRRPAAAARSDF